MCNALASPEGFEPSRTGLEHRSALQGAGRVVGWAGLEPASQLGSWGLKPGRLPIAPPSGLLWCEAPESNREALNFEYRRYASSLQLRVVGAFPGTRTPNIYVLSVARLPIAPGKQNWCSGAVSNSPPRPYQGRALPHELPEQ
jgi:hypothetical protein